ncbi:MAG: cytochrome b/b6 domain-containing protein [Elusimicrobiota bacterium]|nr:cytochrome b/b6 domain-containing protein [Elusimicrobiota bacterium]
MTNRKKVFIYTGFERFWHWAQAGLIIFLAFTGFEIHGVYTFLGYKDAVRYHNDTAYMLLVLIAFATFWHMTTGEWRQYIPTRKNSLAQLEYYIFGIFRNAPHPTKKTVLSKLNPLQKLTYFSLKIFLFPATLASGLLYMFYHYPWNGAVESLTIKSLSGIAVGHTICAFLMVAFLITHLYLITTGETVTSNMKAMLTGFEELEGTETEHDSGK